MKPENILDAIGNVDDNCIKNAKEKKKSLKKYWISIGAMAACLALVVILVHEIGKIPVVIPSVTQTPGSQNPDSKNPDLADPQYAFSYITVYYNFDSKLKIAPAQHSLGKTEMVNVLSYMGSIIESREGKYYKDDEWNYDIQKKDVVIECVDLENESQAEYLLTYNCLFDYQTNTEYTLSEEEVKELKALLWE